MLRRSDLPRERRLRILARIQVAQTCSLLYRCCIADLDSAARCQGSHSADCKSAIQQITNLRYGGCAKNLLAPSPFCMKTIRARYE